MEAPANQYSASTSHVDSNKRKHPNLVLILGIIAGILTVAIISVIMVSLCASCRKKTKPSPEENGMYLQSNFGSIHCLSTLFLVLDV